MTPAETPQNTEPHAPVLLDEVLTFLAPKDNHTYLDATFGRGGYTKAILEAANCNVIALDRDMAAIEFGKNMEANYGGRLKVLHGRFSNMEHILESVGIAKVDGIVFDLGVSSPQLDEAERGFSFAKEGPLDMSMGLASRSAADLVNKAEESELANIIYQYGEERKSRQIAKRIVVQRAEKPFETTTELANLVRSVVKMKHPKKGKMIDPATRTFQALRIAVNEELDELKEALEKSTDLLNANGMLVVVSFHSLEDRIVKVFLKQHSKFTASRLLPHESPEPDPTFDLMTKKAVTPSQAERDRNPRARSAKLRAAKRVREIFGDAA